MSRHPELVESIDEPLNIYLRIAELLARYQEEGQLHKEPPLHTLAVLLGPVMYSTMMSKAMPGRDLPPFDLQYHLQYFLEGRSVKNRAPQVGCLGSGVSTTKIQSVQGLS